LLMAYPVDVEPPLSSPRLVIEKIGLPKADAANSSREHNVFTGHLEEHLLLADYALNIS
jgi:hypothetical protein